MFKTDETVSGKKSRNENDTSQCESSESCEVNGNEKEYSSETFNHMSHNAETSLNLPYESNFDTHSSTHDVNSKYNNRHYAHDHEPPKEDTSDDDTRCGIGTFHPVWLQWLASKKSYILVMGLFGLLDNATNSYFIATISTMEKRFKINSKISGFLSCSFDIGVVVSSLFISYLGARGHKIRWMSVGTIWLSIACFMKLLPHIIYGPGQDALELTVEYGNEDGYNVSVESIKSFELCNSKNIDEEDCSEGTGWSVPVIILLISHILSGMGCAVYFTLGLSYLDDNMQKSKVPFGLGILNCIRLMGPSVGYFFGSYALEKYVDPSLTPIISNDDPKWIGAWWYGWTHFGVISIIVAVLVSLFPRILPRTAMRQKMAQVQISIPGPSFKDFGQTVYRIFTNKIFFYNTASAVAYFLGLIGYWHFMPKYIETQFRQSASTASLITGSIGLVCSALGFFFGGLFISKVKPNARILAAMSVTFEFMEAGGHVAYAFLRCEDMVLHGYVVEDNSWISTTSCNNHCGCNPGTRFTPVCSSDGITTFYSVCHAGCSSDYIQNGTQYFGNCSCIESGVATSGICPAECTTNFVIFLIIQCVMKFFIALGKTGNSIIQLRCVDAEDKSMVIGLTETVLCALCFIPGPVLIGSLLDYTCIVWGEICGEQGNCWLYDGKSLGYLTNFFTATLVFLSAFLDIGVWYYVKDLKIYDEEEIQHMKEKAQINAKKINSDDESDA